MSTQLTQEIALEIGNAYRRVLELSDTKITTPAQDAEKMKLQQFLSATVPKYLGELLGCWFAIRNEYEPLINSVGRFLGRLSQQQPPQAPTLNANQKPVIVEPGAE